MNHVLTTLLRRWSWGSCVAISISCVLYSVHVHGLISHLPKIDLYTGNYLSKKQYSVEHIIPKRFFQERSHANDLLNLAPCDRMTNQLRSDYRYGHVTTEIMQENDCMILKSQRDEVSGFLHRRRRTFYPSIHADRGLISRSIIQLLHRYPYLYAYLDDIVDRPDTLWQWSSYATSFYEQQRDLYLHSMNDYEYPNENLKKRKNISKNKANLSLIVRPPRTSTISNRYLDPLFDSFLHSSNLYCCSKHEQSIVALYHEVSFNVDMDVHDHVSRLRVRWW